MTQKFQTSNPTSIYSFSEYCAKQGNWAEWPKPSENLLNTSFLPEIKKLAWVLSKLFNISAWHKLANYIQSIFNWSHYNEKEKRENFYNPECGTYGTWAKGGIEYFGYLAGVSKATAHRWFKILEQIGLVFKKSKQGQFGKHPAIFFRFWKIKDFLKTNLHTEPDEEINLVEPPELSCEPEPFAAKQEFPAMRQKSLTVKPHYKYIKENIFLTAKEQEIGNEFANFSTEKEEKLDTLLDADTKQRGPSLGTEVFEAKVEVLEASSKIDKEFRVLNNESISIPISSDYSSSHSKAVISEEAASFRAMASLHHLQWSKGMRGTEILQEKQHDKKGKLVQVLWESDRSIHEYVMNGRSGWRKDYLSMVWIEEKVSKWSAFTEENGVKNRIEGFVKLAGMLNKWNLTSFNIDQAKCLAKRKPFLEAWIDQGCPSVEDPEKINQTEAEKKVRQEIEQKIDIYSTTSIHVKANEYFSVLTGWLDSSGFQYEIINGSNKYSKILGEKFDIYGHSTIDFGIVVASLSNEIRPKNIPGHPNSEQGLPVNCLVFLRQFEKYMDNYFEDRLNELKRQQKMLESY